MNGKQKNKHYYRIDDNYKKDKKLKAQIKEKMIYTDWQKFLLFKWCFPRIERQLELSGYECTCLYNLQDVEKN